MLQERVYQFGRLLNEVMTVALTLTALLIGIFAFLAAVGSLAAAQDVLVDSVCEVDDVVPRMFQFTQTESHWCGVAVNPRGLWNVNIEVYGNADGSGEPLARSDNGFLGATDYVVGDFRHNDPNTYYPRVYGDFGGWEYIVEWENGADILNLGDPVTRTIGGTTGDCGIIDVWDIYLPVGNNFTFTLTRESGTAELWIDLHKSNDGVYWSGRDGAVENVRAEDTPFNYNVTSTDHYAVVVYNFSEGSQPATYTLLVEDAYTGCEALNDEVCKTDIGIPHWYRFNQDYIGWACVAVNPSDTDDKNISVYDECHGDTEIVSSTVSSGTDFIVGNFYTGHTPMGTYYAEVSGGADDLLFVAQWDRTDTYLDYPSFGAAGTVGGGGTGDCGLVKTYSYNMLAGGEYIFELTKEGEADVRLALFPPPEGVYWANRNDAEFELGEGSGPYEELYVAPSTGTYGLVVFNNSPGSPEGSYVIAGGVDADCHPLSDGVCSGEEDLLESWFESDQQLARWAAVAVNPTDASNVSLEVYPDCGTGEKLAESVESDVTEFILADFNNIGPTAFYSWINSNDIDWLIQWDEGEGDLPLLEEQVGSVGGGDGESCGLVRVWDFIPVAGKTYRFTFKQTGGQATIRAALYRHDTGDYPNWVGRGDADAELFEITATSGDGTIIEQTFDETGHYAVVVFNDSADSPSGSYSLLVESTCDALTEGVCRTDTGVPQWYSCNQLATRWTAVAVKPGAGDDKDLRIFEQCFGTSVLTSSQLPGTQTDYVAVDCEVYGTGQFYPMVDNEGILASHTAQWDGGGELNMGSMVAGSVGGEGECGLIRAFDLDLMAGLTYTFTLTRTAGDADIKAALFRSSPTGWVKRGGPDQLFEISATESGTIEQYTPVSQGKYGVVVFNDSPGSETGDYLLVVADCRTIPEDDCISDVGTNQWPQWYACDGAADHWAGVAIRGDGKNLSVWTECGGGIRLAGSQETGSETDFVVGDLQGGAALYHAKVSGNDPDLAYNIERKTGEPLAVGDIVYGDVGSDPDCGLLRIFELNLEGGRTYGFGFDQISGSAEILIALFRGGEDVWKGRGSAIFLRRPGDQDVPFEEVDIAGHEAGSYALVVFSNSAVAVAGSYSLVVQEWPKGACCDGEYCYVTTPYRCHYYGDLYVGDDIPCGPSEYTPCTIPLVLGGLSFWGEDLAYDGSGIVRLRDNLRVGGFKDGEPGFEFLHLGPTATIWVDYANGTAVIDTPGNGLTVDHRGLVYQSSVEGSITLNPRVDEPEEAWVKWEGLFTAGIPTQDIGVYGRQSLKPNAPTLLFDQAVFVNVDNIFPPQTLADFSGEINLSERCTRFTIKAGLHLEREVIVIDGFVFIPFSTEHDVAIELSLDFTNSLFRVLFTNTFLEIGEADGAFSLSALPAQGGVEVRYEVDQDTPVDSMLVVKSLSVGISAGGGDDASKAESTESASLPDGDRQLPIGIGVTLDGRDRFEDDNCNGKWDPWEEYTDDDDDGEFSLGSVFAADFSTPNLYLRASGTIDLSFLYYVTLSGYATFIELDFPNHEMHITSSDGWFLGEEDDPWFSLGGNYESDVIIDYGPDGGIWYNTIVYWPPEPAPPVFYTEATGEASWTGYIFDQCTGVVHQDIDFWGLLTYRLQDASYMLTRNGLEFESDLYIGPFTITVVTEAAWNASGFSGSITRDFELGGREIAAHGSTFTIDAECLTMSLKFRLLGFGKTWTVSVCEGDPRGRTDASVWYAIRGPADLHFYDTAGRHVGRNDRTGAIDVEIPGANYVETEDGQSKLISLPEVDLSGENRLVLEAHSAGPCSLEVRYPVHDEEKVNFAQYHSISDLEPGGLAELTISQDQDFLLRVDRDGNGSWDDFIDPEELNDMGLDAAIVRIYGVDVATAEDGAAEVSWRTNVPATSAVYYGFDSTYGDTISVENELVCEHSVVLPDLVPDATYHFLVSSIDSTGTPADFVDMTFLPAELTSLGERQEDAQDDILHSFHVIGNPSIGRIGIEFELDRAEDLEVVVFDVQGRTVWSSGEARYEVGIHTMEVGGSEGIGRELPSGTYFIQLKGDTWTTTRSLVLVR